MDKLLVVFGALVLLGSVGWRAWRMGPWRFVDALGAGLSWDAPSPLAGLGAMDSALLWLLHAGGVAYLWRLRGQNYAAALPLGLATAALLLLPQWPAPCRRQKLDVTVLSALALPYALGLACGLHLLPDDPGLLLLQGTEAAAAGYALLAQVQRRWGGRAAPLVALAGTGAWALWAYLGSRTRGVTGSDPYCYAQMAVDLARTGDVRHTFGLLPLVRDTGLPWWPLVHVGYHVPSGATGLAATVWPVGWPVLLAAGYRLLGETGLYVWAPLAGLLALVVTAALALELWPRGRERWLGVALALFILATSREQVLQLLVPMADVPAQLFTTLAVWLALRAGRRGSVPLAALAGLALGVAYDIRHTQVFLAPVLALALWTTPTDSTAEAQRTQSRGEVTSPLQPLRSLRLCGVFGLVAAAAAGALLAAAPDLWYHRLAFGSVWRPESPELNLIGLSHWWGNAQRMAAALATRAEFGLLLPWLLAGLVLLWRERRRDAAVLVAWVALSAGTQFLYGPLRWRDLLSLLPALALITAYGATGLLRWAGRVARRRAWAPGWLALALALLVAWRSGTVLGWPLLKAEMIFGYMTAEQRQAFDRLGSLVEPAAVVGTALNSGPVELYTGRWTFRPGDWSAAHLDAFLAAMSVAGRPAYIVDDGNEHAATVARLQREGRLTAIAALGVPLYGEPAQLTGMLYRIR
ncbi:MAG TPA: hypothetical protein PLJ35_18405 [Anaerolineae bacterium]|nr:hypothetical protein [Anaerolineae bacterium]HPL28122.1 hypothetical protein [Anaerolineae bacterium]